MLDMYILNRHFNNRAISQVIAALLLIAIAVAAAILVYVFSIGLLGSLAGGGGQQVKQQLIMEAYNWIPFDGDAKLTLRNVGTADITVADVFIGGVAGIPAAGATNGCTAGTVSGTFVVPVQTGCTLDIAPPASVTITGGVAYTIKIVTSDGAVFSYSAIAGQAS